MLDWFDVAPAAGFAASLLTTAVLVARCGSTTDADRTPVTEAEIDATVSEAEAILAQDPTTQETHDLFDHASFVRGHLEHILWRLPADASQRRQINDLCERLRTWAAPSHSGAETRG